MKKFFKYTFTVALIAVAGIAAFGWFGVNANDSELAEIKGASDVIVLRVSGMT